jgi:hypothetical protein
MPRRLVLIAFAGSIALSAGLLVSAATAAPTRSAASELKSVLAAGDAQESVRWVSIESLGSKRLVISTDAGRSIGIQRITYTNAGYTGHAIVELVSGVLYIRGDAMTLVEYFGLKKSQATKVANKWFAMRSNIPDYQAVVAGVTISTTVSELKMTGPITYGSDQTVNGKPTFVIRGKTLANVANTGNPSMAQSLYIASRGQPLPLKVVVSYEGTQSAVDFSNWGRVIKETAPVGAIAFSSSWLQ